MRRVFARLPGAAVMTLAVSMLVYGQASSPSADEVAKAQAIANGATPAAKLKAAEEFIKKYPKSSLRPRVAAQTVDVIAGVTDQAQKITLAQEFQGAFTEPAEQQMIVTLLVQTLGEAKRVDDAFSTGAAFLAKNPDSLQVLVQLLATGTDQAKQRNPKYIEPSLKYGSHAIELIEGNKKPAEVDDAGWTQYRTSVLPSLYQSMGILHFVKGNRAETKTSLKRAAELAPSDPFNHMLVAQVLNDEYEEAAKHNGTISDASARSEDMKKVLVMMDQVIDAYAQFIALAEGHDRLNEARAQFAQDLERYYKYRHRGSTEGMQQLIDKYKVAKP
jgi:hypothetical protein